jgi:acyl carrier protein
VATAQEKITSFVLGRFRAAIARNELRPDEPLISTGIIDSFGLLELIAWLEDTFAVTIDPGQHEMTEFETVNQIAELVDRAPRQ